MKKKSEKYEEMRKLEFDFFKFILC